jgi:aspartate/methionine/tyrosine aminotransferase
MTKYSDHLAKNINDALKDSGLTQGKPVTLIRFDADLITANTFDITINAVAVAQTTFITDQVATMKAIVANLILHASVDSAEIHNTSNGDPWEIIINGTEGGTLTLTGLTVAAGASQANVEEDTESGVVGSVGTRAIAALPVLPISTAGTSTPTTPASGAASATVAAANTARTGLIIYNDSTEILLINYGAAASLTAFVTAIQQGQEWVMPLPAYTGVVNGISLAADATGVTRVTELTD